MGLTKESVVMSELMPCGGEVFYLVGNRLFGVEIDHDTTGDDLEGVDLDLYAPYVVTEYIACAECGHKKNFVDSMSGIYATDEIDAVKYFVEYFQ
jgi:hypothetical protein